MPYHCCLCSVFEQCRARPDRWRVHLAGSCSHAGSLAPTQEAKLALHAMLSDPLMSGKPLLIFANKQDLPKALKAGEVGTGLHKQHVRRTAPHTPILPA